MGFTILGSSVPSFQLESSIDLEFETNNHPLHRANCQPTPAAPLRPPNSSKRRPDMQCGNVLSPRQFRPPLPQIPNFRANHPPTQQRKQTHKNVRRNVDNGAAPLIHSPVKSITSTSNSFVKHCVKLRQSSSYRHSHGSVLVVGTTPIREIYNFQQSIDNRNAIIDCLLLLDNVEVPEELNNPAIRILRISSLVMEKLSGIESSESIEAVALMRIPATFRDLNQEQNDGSSCKTWFRSTHRILVLDGIQDPGNLGTLLRSAVAFNWNGVFLLPGCCDPFNDKALRSSRGANFQIPIVSGKWEHLECLRKESQIKIVAGEAKSDDDESKKPLSNLGRGFVESLSDEEGLCMVLGSEGRGLSEKSKAECELFVNIPMAGKYESLNVSVAGGIFMFLLQPNLT